ncbi:anaerobic ribonucleoside-triphosphate reductase activating protein [bacterium]|nr:anaerobic ribonucleoside-triphosphate reductase activating protein [bacterium]
MRIYKIIKNTIAEGPGKRFCIWVQGCSRHCNGCFAKETWDFNSGEDYSINTLIQLIKSEQDIEGVTFLGGEPFEQAQELSKLATEIKKTGLSIVCFTGYKIEELQSKKDKNIKNLLNEIDLLIDGEFEKENFDISRPWVGSSNQRYIFLTDRYNEEEIMKYKNKIELHINPDGQIEINGMGDFENLQNNFCLQLSENNVK